MIQIQRILVLTKQLDTTYITTAFKSFSISFSIRQTRYDLGNGFLSWLLQLTRCVIVLLMY